MICLAQMQKPIPYALRPAICRNFRIPTTGAMLLAEERDSTHDGATLWYQEPGQRMGRIFKLMPTFCGVNQPLNVVHVPIPQSFVGAVD